MTSTDETGALNPTTSPMERSQTFPEIISVSARSVISTVHPGAKPPNRSWTGMLTRFWTRGRPTQQQAKAAREHKEQTLSRFIEVKEQTCHEW